MKRQKREWVFYLEALSGDKPTTAAFSLKIPSGKFFDNLRCNDGRIPKMWECSKETALGFCIRREAEQLKFRIYRRRGNEGPIIVCKKNPDKY